MQAENQLDVVRKKLGAMPRSEWPILANESGIVLRTIYTIFRIDSRPSYDSVFSIYKVLAKRAAKATKAGKK